MSEGLAPDPTPLAEYNRMLASMATEHSNVSYLDVAGALHSRHSSRFFLDDCHLTNTGHRFVAELLSRHLHDEGVLNDAP